PAAQIAPEVAPVPVEPPPPAAVAAHVIVTTDPANAQLMFDRQAVANPFDAQMSVGDHHLLEAHAPGYVTAGRELRVSGDERVTLSLTKEAPPPAPVAPAAVVAPKPAPKPA